MSLDSVVGNRSLSSCRNSVTVVDGQRGRTRVGGRPRPPKLVMRTFRFPGAIVYCVCKSVIECNCEAKFGLMRSCLGSAGARCSSATGDATYSYHHVTNTVSHNRCKPPHFARWEFLVGFPPTKVIHFCDRLRPPKTATFQHRPSTSSNTATMLIPKADRKKIHEVIIDRRRKANCSETDHLVVPLPRGCPRRPEGLQPPQAPRYRHQEPVRYQGLPVAHQPRLCQDPVLVAILLLHSDPRGPRLPPRMAPPPRRDCSCHPHQAAAIARSSPWHARRG